MIFEELFDRVLRAFTATEVDFMIVGEDRWFCRKLPWL